MLLHKKDNLHIIKNILNTLIPRKKMNSKVRIASILTRYPELEELLANYDVDDLEEESIQTMNIEDFCDAHDIDLEDFLMDLEEMISDSRNAEWLSNTEDEWSDRSEFTEEFEESGSNFGREGGFDSEDNDFDD